METIDGVQVDARAAVMLPAQFVDGGPLDGVTLNLTVVPMGPDAVAVLPAVYERPRRRCAACGKEETA